MYQQLEEKTLSREDCILHYWTSSHGSGPWVIFLHGAGGDHRTFTPQLASIPSFFNILLPDLRGHGRSKPLGSNYSIDLVLDDILALMDRAGCKRATFIGLSMGGNIAQELVYRYPQKVDGLILIGCVCNTLEQSPWEKALKQLTPHIFKLIPWSLLIRLSSWIGCKCTKERLYLRQTFSQLNKQEFMQIFAATANCMHPDPEYRITHQFLLLLGSKDYSINIQNNVRHWACRDPECQVYQIPGARHCANLDNPEPVNALISRFLYKVNTPL